MDVNCRGLGLFVPGPTKLLFYLRSVFKRLGFRLKMSCRNGL